MSTSPSIPLEATTVCAKDGSGSLATLAMAEGGSLLHAPDIYMNKIAIGPGYPDDTVDLDASAADNINSLAKAKGVTPQEITACILDRPRHAKLIADVRATGAAIRLIGDGDIAGVIYTVTPDEIGDRHLHRLGWRSRRRARRGGVAVHRRPDPGPADAAQG